MWGIGIGVFFFAGSTEKAQNLLLPEESAKRSSISSLGVKKSVVFRCSPEDFAAAEDAWNGGGLFSWLFDIGKGSPHGRTLRRICWFFMLFLLISLML